MVFYISGKGEERGVGYGARGYLDKGVRVSLSTLCGEDEILSSNKKENVSSLCGGDKLLSSTKEASEGVQGKKLWKPRMKEGNRCVFESGTSVMNRV